MAFQQVSSQRQKRLLTDLRKRLPEFPCSIGESGLQYTDLIKLDKRAAEVQVSSVMGGARLEWIREVLEDLEKWAAEAIKVNESGDPRSVRAIAKAGEETFSPQFMKSVPLFKLLIRTNRKKVKLLEEYEARPDDWIPLSLTFTSMDQLSSILSEMDSEKLSNLYMRWDRLVTNGYFDLQAVLELLKGLHDDDLRTHASFPLLQKALKLLSIDLSRIDAEPIFVRVRSSVVAKLVSVVALTPAFSDDADLPSTYALEVSRAVERSNDAGFKKLCESRLNLLMVKTFPAKVASLLEDLHRPYGQKESFHQLVRRRKQKGGEVTAAYKSGMRTRSRTGSKKRSVKPSTVSFKRLEDVVKEGERLYRVSRRDEHVFAALDLAKSEMEIFEAKRLEITSNLDDADILNWDLPDQWTPEWLALYRHELRFRASTVVAAAKGLKPGLFPDELVRVKDTLFRLRLEARLAGTKLIAFHEIDHCISVIPEEERDFGLVSEFTKILVEVKILLKKKPAPHISDLRAWVNEVEKVPRVDVSGKEEVRLVKRHLAQAEHILAQAEELSHRFGARAKSLDEIVFSQSDILELRGIASAVDDIRDLVVLVDKRTSLDQPVTSIEWIQASVWYSDAKSAVSDISTLIDLNRRANMLGLHLMLLASSQVPRLVEDIAGRVETISRLISEIRGGDFEKISLLDSQYVVIGELERIKMDIADFEAFSAIAHQLVHGDRVNVSISRVGHVVAAIDGFCTQYNAEQQDGVVETLKELLVLNGSLGDIREREELEQALSRLAGIVSEEISGAEKHLSKMREVESGIDSLARKQDQIEEKYELLKKCNKLKISVSDKSIKRLVVSLHASLVAAVQTSGKPKWVHLYVLRALGGIVGKSKLEWVSKQLDACNEILKDSKKSFTDFCRNRFMVAAFHCDLYEPMETIRKNFQDKLTDSKIVFNYNESVRRLESIAVTTTEGNVTDRQFPRVGGFAKSLLVEPENSDRISPLFENRKVPDSISAALDQILRLAKDVLAEQRQMRQLSTTSAEKKTAASAATGMSFTKFLSSSFSNLDISASDAAEVPDMDTLLTPSAEGGNKSFLDRYYELMRARSVVVPSGASTPLETPAVKTGPPAIAGPPIIGGPPAIVVPPGLVRSGSAKDSGGPSVWEGDIAGPRNSFRFKIGLVPLFTRPTKSEQSLLRQVLAGHSCWQFEGQLPIGKFVEHYVKLMHPAHRAKREPFNFVITGKEDENFFEALPVNTASAFVVIAAPYKIKLWVLAVDAPIHPLAAIARTVFGFMEIPQAVLPGGVENVFELSDIYAAVESVRASGGKMGVLDAPLVQQAPATQPPVQTGPVHVQPHPEQGPGRNDDPLISRMFEVMAASRDVPGRGMEIPHPRDDNRMPQRGRDFEPSDQRGHGREREYEAPRGDHRGRDEHRIPERNMDFSPPPRESKRPREEESWSAERRWNDPQPPVAPSWQPPTHWGAPTYRQVAPVGNPSMPGLVIGAPSTGVTIDQMPNPKRGACRFFNMRQGCQGGSRCRYSHNCTVCGSEDHGATFHDQMDYSAPPGYHPSSQPPPGPGSYYRY